jgi:hypothetical protein
MIDLVLELAAGGAVTTAAARLALHRRYRRAVIDVGKQLAELERWHEIESTARLAGYDPDLCVAAADRGSFIQATCARRLQPQSRRELEQELFFGPGAVWPVENGNYVQIVRPAMSWTAAPAHAVLVSRGLDRSALAAQMSLDDEFERQ